MESIRKSLLDKGIVFRIYKEFDNTKANNPAGKLSGTVHIVLPKNMQIASGHLKNMFNIISQ